MEMKTYVLLKDLPDHPKGTVFVWDGSRGKYKTELDARNGAEPYSCFMGKFVENNPEWFKLKEDKIEVTDIRLHEGESCKNWVVIETNKNIPLSKYPSIKKAIEAVLNDEPVKVYMNFDVVNAPRKYTEKELLDAEEKAFNAGREIVASFDKEFYPSFKKYKSFTDYKNKK